MFSFFATPVDDGYGGFTYHPTMLSYTILVLLMLILLLAASAFHAKISGENVSDESKSRRVNLRQLAFSSMAIALSIVGSMIRLFSLPMGGEVTLCSMLFVTLIGSWFGLNAGLSCGIALGLLRLIIDPYIISIPQLLCDYVLAFGALGLSGLFYRKHQTAIPAIITGYLTGIFGRFVFSVLSGVIFFASYAPAEGPFHNPLLYSAAYNGSYIAAEGALTIVILLLPPVRKAVENISRIANG